MTSLRPSRRAALGMLGAIPLAAGGVLALPGQAQAGAGHRPVPADLLPDGALDRLIAQTAAADGYSGTVLLLRDGRPVLSRTYGLANRELSLPNRPDTIFSLGSVTKIFTGIAIAQLVQQGKVAYHETLGTYLDGFPTEVAGTVTIHQLLTHTAGMGDILREQGDLLNTWGSEAEVVTELLELMRASPLLFPPGTGYAYSNNGYITLAYVVAAASGQTFYDYVRRHIFRPAGMSNADFYNRDQWAADRRIARPYAPPPTGGARVDNLRREPYVGNGAGGAFATAADLVAFVAALTGDRLLDRRHTWLATSPKSPVVPLPPKPGRPSQFLFGCYGPSATLMNNHWCLGHNGGSTNGVSTDLEWFPDDGYVYIDLCNYEGGSSAPIDIAARGLIVQ